IAADIIIGIPDALRSLRCQERRQRTHARACFQRALRIRTIVQNFAAELVPEHDIAAEVHRFTAWEMAGQFDHAVSVFARVQVGTANAAGQGLDQHLSRGRLWLRQITYDDLAVPENGSAQSVSSRRCSYCLY